MTKKQFWCLTVGLIMLTWAGNALAQAKGGEEALAPVGSEPSVAVVEVYVSNVNSIATPEYSRAVADRLLRLGRYAVMDRNELLGRFKAVLITPLRRLQIERLTAIERLIREGDELVYSDPKAAVEVLGRARAELESIVEGIAANERLREEFLKTMMLLARSHLDTGNEVKASEVLAEVIRIYGDGLEVSERDYHPNLVRLYKKVKERMEKERQAVMTVQTVQPGCTTLLDGRPLEGQTPTEYRRLFPGVHHVQVRCGEKESMIRRVVLSNIEPVHLMVDVDFESVLSVEGGKLGLTFEKREDAERLVGPYGAKFGAIVNADLVVALGFLEPGTRGDLRSWLIDVRKGEVVRATSVPAKSDVVTPSSVERTVADLTTEPQSPVVEVRRPPEKRAWYENYWAWTAVGVGVALLGASAGLYASYLDHRSNATSPYKDNGGAGSLAEFEWKRSEADKALKMRNGAVACLGVGAASVASGVVLFVLTDKIWPGEEAKGGGGNRLVALPVVGSGGGGGMVGISF